MAETTTSGQANTDPASQATDATTASAAASATTDKETASVAQQAASATEASAANPAGTEKTAEIAAPKAPEKYEFKATEGFNPDVIAEFSEVAKSLDLPQEAAQQILDKVGPKIATEMQKSFDATKQQWAEAAKADKEFGGDKFKENLAVASKAIDAFGTPGLKQLLDETGLGNHPEMIRAFYKAGKAISEDVMVRGGSAAPKTKPLEDRLYPKTAT